MTALNTAPQIKTHKASRLLTAKIGPGPLDESLIPRCQALIDNNDTDFTPMAREYLDRLKLALEAARAANTQTPPTVQSFITPVMELKANASIFRYTLIGGAANIILGFLETITRIDNDVLKIIEAHHRAFSVIIAQGITGDGGQNGQRIKTELNNACLRYFVKNAKKA
ncbi:MAG: hypothetical protein IT559_06040 [Alphaproteobacteria bacterium]|nr:hypothetical protein [Alphaproteobacteria bacterium]